jgi:hypothetical protein
VDHGGPRAQPDRPEQPDRADRAARLIDPAEPAFQLQQQAGHVVRWLGARLGDQLPFPAVVPDPVPQAGRARRHGHLGPFGERRQQPFGVDTRKTLHRYADQLAQPLGGAQRGRRVGVVQRPQHPYRAGTGDPGDGGRQQARPVAAAEHAHRVAADQLGGGGEQLLVVRDQGRVVQQPGAAHVQRRPPEAVQVEDPHRPVGAARVAVAAVRVQRQAHRAGPGRTDRDLQQRVEVGGQHPVVEGLRHLGQQVPERLHAAGQLPGEPVVLRPLADAPLQPLPQPVGGQRRLHRVRRHVRLQHRLLRDHVERAGRHPVGEDPPVRPVDVDRPGAHQLRAGLLERPVQRPVVVAPGGVAVRDLQHAQHPRDDARRHPGAEQQRDLVDPAQARGEPVQQQRLAGAEPIGRIGHVVARVDDALIGPPAGTARAHPGAR